MDRLSWICFRGRDALERKSFRKVFLQLHFKQIMDLAVGRFRLCSAPSCAGAEATKAHLEAVQLNVRIGPGSFIDRYLWRTFDLDVTAELVEQAISFSYACSTNFPLLFLDNLIK